MDAKTKMLRAIEARYPDGANLTTRGLLQMAGRAWDAGAASATPRRGEGSGRADADNTGMSDLFGDLFTRMPR